MLRGMPTTMSSICRDRMSSFTRSTRAKNGSAGINSSGRAIIRSSSLTATPTRTVPGSRARMRIAQSSEAESVSMSSTAAGLRRSIEAGQSEFTGPWSIFFTGTALRFSGATQTTFRAVMRAGNVSVKA